MLNHKAHICPFLILCICQNHCQQTLIYLRLNSVAMEIKSLHYPLHPLLLDLAIFSISKTVAYFLCVMKARINPLKSLISICNAIK